MALANSSSAHARSRQAAVPFAGQYRIIDITLSNCINSDLRHVYILTQYKGAIAQPATSREGWGPVMANELGGVH